MLPNLGILNQSANLDFLRKKEKQEKIPNFLMNGHIE